jgi:hypothetical protein
MIISPRKVSSFKASWHYFCVKLHQFSNGGLCCNVFSQKLRLPLSSLYSFHIIYIYASSRTLGYIYYDAVRYLLLL